MKIQGYKGILNKKKKEDKETGGNESKRILVK